MVLEFFGAAEMDQAAIQHLDGMLEAIRSTARAAASHGYFVSDDEDAQQDDGEDDTHPPPAWMPADLDESCARCTFERIKEYCINTVIDEFLESRGISGYSFEVVLDGWEGIDYGDRNDLLWVMMCHRIAGLGVISHPRRGWSSYNDSW